MHLRNVSLRLVLNSINNIYCFSKVGASSVRAVLQIVKVLLQDFTVLFYCFV